MVSQCERQQLNSLPYLLVMENNVVEVGDKFLELTGHEKSDILHNDIYFVFYSLLRLNVDPNRLESSKRSYFIFSKNLDFREVGIQTEILGEENVKVFIFEEINNMRFEDRYGYLEQVCRDNIVGVSVYALPDMVLVKTNQKYLDFMEHPYNEKANSIGRRIDEIIAGWKNSPAESYWKEAINKGKSVQVKEYMHIEYKKGATYWNSIITPILENGKAKFVVSNTFEVTERVMQQKKVEEQAEAIRQQKEQMEVILENMSDALLVCDKDGKYIFKNKAALDMIYIQSFNKVGDSLEAVRYFDLEGNELPTWSLPAHSVLKGEKTTEQILTAATPKGKLYLSISATPLFNDDGSLRMGVVCMRDITESKRQNQVIRQQKKQLEAIVDNISDGIFLVHKDGNRIEILNNAARDFFYQPDKVKTVDEYINQGNTRYYDFEENELKIEDLPGIRALKGETVKEFMMTAVYPDRIRRHYNLSGNPVYDKNGDIPYSVVSCRDVTELIKYEQMIKKQQESAIKVERAEKKALKHSMKMKDEFLTTITHEFKTPLTVINAALQSLENIYGEELSDSVKKYLQKIRTNSFRQLRLVNNLLDITRYKYAGNIRISKQNHDIVFLTRAITQSVKLFAKQKGLNLEFSSDIDCREMAIDEEKYERILLNLLSNAIKFTPKGKSIHVCLSVKNKKAVVAVKDEGAGIPKNKQEFIFERFGQVDSILTRQAEGTGIGLSLVKSLVKVLNGTITLDSEVGKGSTFTVTLPVTKLRRKVPQTNMTGLRDSRIMQAVAIEFSDIYLD